MGHGFVSASSWVTRIDSAGSQDAEWLKAKREEDEED